MNLKMEQISHKVDQLNSYVEEILHDQNDINRQQEETSIECCHFRHFNIFVQSH